MNLSRYTELSKQLEDMERVTEERKRASYTAGNDNVLHNFVRDGEISGIGALQNLLQHFLKQVAGIVSYIKNPDVEPAESLASRAGDVRTYCKLLVALAEDEGRVTGLEELLDSPKLRCKEVDRYGRGCIGDVGHAWPPLCSCGVQEGTGSHTEWPPS